MAATSDNSFTFGLPDMTSSYYRSGDARVLRPEGDADRVALQGKSRPEPAAASGGKRLLPRHIGFIPDGNRRWASARGMSKQTGYRHGIEPGLALFERCMQLGIEEVSVYGFTQDNTRRPAVQADAFRRACSEFGLEVHRRGAALLAVGDERSAMFPQELAPFRQRQGEGLKINFLVNYGWEWDIDGLRDGALRSADVSRIDLIVRWGGGRRLSGFLPLQSVYADVFVHDAMWPDFQPSHLDDALAWFARQDRTLGG